MTLADGIRKHGFRKWYERELLRGHAHLVLTFFCVIGIFGAFGGATRPWSDRPFDAAAIVLCTTAGVWALRRYLGLLTCAEAVASQAECRQCRTYGRLDLLQSDAAGTEIKVRCRQCGHGWRISG